MNRLIAVLNSRVKTIILFLCCLLFTSALTSQTLKYGNVTDADGNIYPTVVFGNYEWMAENLQTTSYQDGLKIPNINDSIAWTGLREGAYCWYNKNESNAKTYGALYNWYAVNTGKLCPDGWRVPADEDWKVLEGYVDTQYGIGNSVWDKSGGRGNDAAQRLKKSSGWSSEGNGKDYIGFSALPGGERCSNGRFFLAGRSGFWWTSTSFDESGAWYRNMIYSLEDVIRNTHPKWMGFSVRCLRDTKPKQNH